MVLRALAVIAFGTIVAACAGTCPPAPAPSATPCPTCTASALPAALVLTESKHDFPTTVTRLEEAIAGKGLKVMARIDHQANARGAGLDLPPTTVLVFGNPMVGTKLMQESRTIGLDLPLRMLVWERADRTVQVVFRDAAGTAREHGIGAESELVSKVQGVLSALADAASH